VIFHNKAQSPTDQYLTHHWPFCEGTMNDVTGSAHMLQGSATSFASDRFGNPYSALALNGGWTQIPTGIYFNTLEFTILVWVYPINIGFGARVIDFANGGAPSDNIILALSTGSNVLLDLTIDSGPNKVVNARMNQTLPQNQWQFVAATFNGLNSRIYLNGALVAESFQSYTLTTLARSNCYIGKSNWPDGYSSSFLDDLRFYNKSLTQSEILEIMNQNETSK